MACNVATSCRNVTPVAVEVVGACASWPKMVPRGLEPRTLRLLAVRSNQLSYETVAAEVKGKCELTCHRDACTWAKRPIQTPKPRNPWARKGPACGKMVSECSKIMENSATGTRTRVARVRAEYPNQLDYSGFEICLRPSAIVLGWVAGLRSRAVKHCPPFRNSKFGHKNQGRRNEPPLGIEPRTFSLQD